MVGSPGTVGSGYSPGRGSPKRRSVSGTCFHKTPICCCPGKPKKWVSTFSSRPAITPFENRLPVDRQFPVLKSVFGSDPENRNATFTKEKPRKSNDPCRASTIRFFSVGQEETPLGQDRLLFD